MAYLYDYRNFNQIGGIQPDALAHDLAIDTAKVRKHMVVVEIGDDYYRVTPKGRRLSMPSWFMPATLGGSKC